MKVKDLKKLLEKVSADRDVKFKVSEKTEGFEDFDFDEEIYLDIENFSIEFSGTDGYEEEFVYLS